MRSQSMEYIVITQLWFLLFPQSHKHTAVMQIRFNRQTPRFHSNFNLHTPSQLLAGWWSVQIETLSCFVRWMCVCACAGCTFADLLHYVRRKPWPLHTYCSSKASEWARLYVFVQSMISNGTLELTARPMSVSAIQTTKAKVEWWINGESLHWIPNSVAGICKWQHVKTLRGEHGRVWNLTACNWERWCSIGVWLHGYTVESEAKCIRQFVVWLILIEWDLDEIVLPFDY